MCLAKDPEARPDLDQIISVLRRDSEVHTSGHSALVMLAAAAVVVVIGSAFLGWQVLTQSSIDGAGHAIEPTVVHLGNRRHDVEYTLDNGAWTPLTSAPLRLDPGTYTISARAEERGRRLTWAKRIVVTAGDEMQIPVLLSPTRTEEVRLDLPGTGMVYVNGEAMGTDNSLILRWAGTFDLSRWDGRHAWNATVQVDRSGVQPPNWIEADFPSPDAYLVDQHDGHPVLAHHLCCRLEVAWVIRSEPALRPIGWSLGQAHLPATGLTLPLAMAVERARSPYGLRLPSGEEARQLEAIYQTGLWYATPQGPDHTGGTAAANALLILVRR
jgi:hypothetical protein